MKKTQAMRLLDSRGVSYLVTEYDASGEFHSGEEAAALVGAPLERVYKTLVVLPDPPGSAKPMLVMLAVDRQLDLKALAGALDEKKLRMATQKVAEQLTGLPVGGISALALRKSGFVVLIDEAARSLERIHLSAGARGIDLEVAVADLVRVTGARFVRM